MSLNRTIVCSLIACLPLVASAQDGETAYQTYCAACHDNPTDETIPPVARLRQLDANTIVDTLTSGAMRLQGQPLSREQQVQVAEYLAGAPIAARVARFDRGQCERPPALPELTAGAIWNGWSPDSSNSRYQAAAGIAPGDVGSLELKWAFGIPNAQQSRSQPTVVGGRVFMGSQSGAVYALDAETGCLFWTFEANTWVRSAISVGPYPGGYAIFFTDANARAYAVDAQTGLQIWTRQIDDHPAARGTGSPTLYHGVLYVPVSGVSEETAASGPDYECCTFRGSLSALDAATGEVLWKTYTLPEPTRRGTSSTGKPLWGPSGSPIWSAPTIDAKRGLIYAATGNGYADPGMGTSDSIIALSLETGNIEWVNQVLSDIWIMGCGGDAPGAGFGPPGGPGRGGAGRGGFGPPGGLAPPGGSATAENPNCPDEVGPDFDFSASPILTTLADGTDVILATQKAGMGYALDPDNDGATLWSYRWGAGSPVGGVWGATTDGERAYFAVADQLSPNAGGVHAVDIASGERVWFAEPAPTLCAQGPGCSAAQSAALTSMPGVVFSGSADGGVRAYAAATGAVLWEYDTNRDFATVNGIAASGGSIDGPGPVVAGGMLFVTSGNGGIVGMPGNVLLAFGVAQ
jgi:polyvinyl alcohol dehydrogenase (cytochrome)